MKRGSRMVVLAVLAAVTVVPVATPANAAIVVVHNKAELLAALAGAVAGDTVFVDGTVSINLTGEKRIVIPAGVTLASDRGQGGSAGALLYNDELDLGQSETWAQFSLRGAGTRVTGLRLRGPDQQIRDNAYQYDNSRGLEVLDASDLLVDNNELYGWSHAAVYLGDTIEGRVRGNYIHHNRRTGLGYGVVLYNNTSAVIEDNTFTQNRHAIAGNASGTRISSLRFGDFDGDGRTDVFTTSGGQWQFSSAGLTAWQPLATSSAALESLRFGDFNGDGRTDVFQTSGGQWSYSSGGASSWIPLAQSGAAITALAFGDFDGDGRTDVFHTSANQWRFSAGGAGSWQNLATASETLSALRFGDFDGDAKTDVFSISGSQWRYSSGGRTSWISLATSGCPLASLYVAGDFNGDGRSDVFDGRCGG